MLKAVVVWDAKAVDVWCISSFTLVFVQQKNEIIQPPKNSDVIFLRVHHDNHVFFKSDNNPHPDFSSLDMS